MDTQPAITASRLLLTPEQAADTLALGRSRVYELMRDRQIRSIKIGRSRRIPYASLLDFVAGLESSLTPNPPDQARATSDDDVGPGPPSAHDRGPLRQDVAMGTMHQLKITLKGVPSLRSGGGCSYRQSSA